MKTLISVIVPVYKVENYLPKCIESILNQTYDNFELVLVDDGSPDNCGNICEEYAKKDNRIKVIHKKNGGLSDARNVGIEKATGKYITCIDSDDYVDKEYLNNFYKILENQECDLIITGIIDYYDNGQKVEATYSDEFEVLNKETIYKRMLLQDGMDVNATAKLYKKEIFDNIKYPVGELYEDIKIIYDIVDKADTIVFSKYKGYFYLQREDSIMYSNMSARKLVLLDNIENLKNLISKNYPNIENEVIKRYVYCHYHILGRSIYDKNFKEESKNIRKKILKYKKLILKNSIFTKKEKIATLFLTLGLKPYKMMWTMFCKLKNKGFK